jgi:hypothetical protein
MSEVGRHHNAKRLVGKMSEVRWNYGRALSAYGDPERLRLLDRVLRDKRGDRILSRLRPADQSAARAARSAARIQHGVHEEPRNVTERLSRQGTPQRNPRPAINILYFARNLAITDGHGSVPLRGSFVRSVLNSCSKASRTDFTSRGSELGERHRSDCSKCDCPGHRPLPA